MRKLSLLFAFFLILLCVLYSTCNADMWKPYTIADGWAGGNIHAMIEDSKGNLWIATDGDGVSRYDGEEFHNFTTEDGLTSNFVWAILEDRKGDLWFATGNGVCRYDGKGFGTNLNVKDGLVNSFVTSMIEDREGNLWFGTKGGVSKYDGKKFRNFTTEDGLIGNHVRVMLEDNVGNLWFGTGGNGISKYDGKTFRNFTTEGGLADGYVMSILEDREGNLWFGTEGGVSKYDGKKFRNFTTENGLAHNSVGSILEDGDKNLWFGTRDGASRYDGRNFQNFKNTDGLVGDDVRVISESREGNLWFGTWGHGISRYDNDNRIKHYLKDKTIDHALKDSKGNLWFAAKEGGVFRYDGREFQDFTAGVGLTGDTAPTILEGKNGHLWFTGFGGVTRYNGVEFQKIKDTELRDTLVEPIFEDSQGNLWLNMWKNGNTIRIGMYDGERFHHFPIKGRISPSGAEDKRAMEDKKGNIWFASDDNGIYGYDGVGLIHFTMDDGLAGNRVSSVAEDKAGNVWFGIRGNDTPDAKGLGGISMYGGEFNAEMKYQTRLDSGNIPEGLAQAFKNNGILLPQNVGVLVREAGQRWLIKELLFSVRVGSLEELDMELWKSSSKFDKTFSKSFNGNISKDLVQEFKNNGIALSQSIVVSSGEEADRQWLIVDRDNKQAYAVWKNGDKLNVYDNRQTYVIRKSKDKLSIFRFLTYSTRDGLGSDSVTGILRDDNDNLWFRTYHGGLSKYDGGRFENFTTREGLVSNTIRSMLRDSEGNFWFGSQGGGVSKYDGKNFQTLTTADGLLNNTAFVTLVDSRGGIWFRYSIPGLTRYTPSRGILPRAVITRVDADKTYPATSPVRVPSKTRVAFHYKGLTLNQLSNILYVCKLQGYDEDWNPATKRRIKEYENLKSGTYEFQVKAIDRDLNYSEPQSLKLTVLPLFYMRPRFFIPSGIAIFALCLFILEYFSHRRTAVQLKRELQRRDELERQRITKELQDARDMQMNLMSDPPPLLAEFDIFGKCSPAREVGGDFFRCIWLGQDVGKFAIALGDVFGKGMKAAMTAMMADGMLHAEAKFCLFSSGQFLSELNKGLYERKTDYLTLSFASIDIKEKILQFSNAGLPWPLIKREGELSIIAESSGCPLGMMPDTVYGETNITLKEGDTIVFYTDGITDAFNQRDEIYTSERLESMLRSADTGLSARQLVDEIFKDVSRFTTDEVDQYDDMTVLVLKVKERR